MVITGSNTHPFLIYYLVQFVISKIIMKAVDKLGYFFQLNYFSKHETKMLEYESLNPVILKKIMK